MNSKTLQLTTATLLTLATGAAYGQAAYLDFGDKLTTGNVGGVQYNDLAVDGGQSGAGEVPLNLNGGPTTLTPVELLDTDANASGWFFEMDALNTTGNVADNGSNFNGPYPAQVNGFEVTAISSMFFFNRGKDLLLSFSGLDDSATYNLLIYGGHDQIGTLTNSIVTGVPVTGSGADYTSKTMNTWTNSTEVIEWADIAPDGGVIAFNLEGGSRESWLNFMSIEQVGGGGIPGDTDGDGDIDDADLGTSFSNFTGPVGAAGGKTSAEGDTDGDGDVDDADLANSFAGFTGPLGPASVPEPASLALLGLGGLMIARRRRA